jgi:Superfamily II DNA/RNA helicase required for DNA uptake (late competence protein)
LLTDEVAYNNIYMLKNIFTIMNSMRLENGMYGCRMCGTEHNTEIEAIQCGCAFD